MRSFEMASCWLDTPDLSGLAALPLFISSSTARNVNPYNRSLLIFNLLLRFKAA